MTTIEYIDAISRDLQDLISALDHDPHTSALVKGRAKGIQERINHYYNSIFDESRLTQIPDALPYKIGDEGYRDMVGDQEYRSRVTCKLIMPQPSKTFEVCKSCGRVVCKQGDHHCSRTDDE